jgi:hypothetical protein
VKCKFYLGVDGVCHCYGRRNVLQAITFVTSFMLEELCYNVVVNVIKNGCISLLEDLT